MGKERVNPISVITNSVIKKTGLLDFEEMFKSIPSWFKRYNYEAIEKSRNEKPTSTGINLESSWKATRKVTIYVKFIIEMHIWLRDMTEVMVQMPDGKQVRKNKARIEMVFNAKMEKNYRKHLNDEKGSFSNFLRYLYEKFLARRELEKYEDKLYMETTDLMETMRGFFD